MVSNKTPKKMDIAEKVETQPPSYYEQKWIEYFEERQFTRMQRLESVRDQILKLHLAFSPIFISIISFLKLANLFCVFPFVLNMTFIALFIVCIVPSTDIVKETNIDNITNGIENLIKDIKYQVFVSLGSYIFTIIFSAICICAGSLYN